MSDAPANIPTRHAGRERALSLLYEAEARECSVQSLLDELPLPADAFSVELACGVEINREEIDDLLQSHAHGWQVYRMASLDRGILRLATYELGHRPDVPTAVVINEAVELAKEYSTERSGSFVNGVLVAVTEELRPA